jgi:hypothetical protein
MTLTILHETAWCKEERLDGESLDVLFDGIFCIEHGNVGVLAVGEFLGRGDCGPNQVSGSRSNSRICNSLPLCDFVVDFIALVDCLIVIFLGLGSTAVVQGLLETVTAKTV